MMVTAPALETLLTILDARHYYGEYQPNMGLKSAMERVEGSNAQLREQVRLCRQEEERSVAASQRLRSRLASAEAELKAIKGGFLEQPPAHQVAQVVASPVVAATLPPTISSSTSENVAVLENQLIHVLDELEARESSGRRLEAEVATLGKKLAAAKHQVGLLYTDHLEQVARWQEEKGKLQADTTEAEQRLAAAQAKVEEFEEHLKKLGGGEDVAKKKMAETARRVALLRANEAILSRRYKVLETQKEEAVASLEELHKEAATMEARLVRMLNMFIRMVGDAVRHSVYGNLVHWWQILLSGFVFLSLSLQGNQGNWSAPSLQGDSQLQSEWEIENKSFLQMCQKTPSPSLPTPPSPS